MNEQKIMSIYEKLVELRKHVSCLVKDREGYNFNYVTGNQILAKVKDKMNELGLVLIPSANVGEEFFTHDYTTINGVKKTDFIVMGEMSYTWVNVDDPNEKLVIPWAYYGQQDDISQAYGSALTYAERYFWLKALGLPTDEDDPDSRDPKNRSNTKAPPKGKEPPAPIKEPAEKSAKAPSTSAPAAEKPASPVHSQHDEAKKIFQNNNKNGKTISEAQVRRLFALAQGNKGVVAAVLTANGIEKEEDILAGDQYKEICAHIERMANNQEEIASE